MKKINSIANLRKICQKDTGIPASEILQRKISIYFTKIFIYINITANLVTLISLVVGILSGIFFIFGYDWSMLIGSILLFFHIIFDNCDGEVARYRGNSSISGSYIDRANHMVISPYIFAAICFGLYFNFNDIKIFIFGFFTVISELLIILSVANIYVSVCENKLNNGDRFTTKNIKHGNIDNIKDTDPQKWLKSRYRVIYNIVDIMLVSIGRTILLIIFTFIDLLLFPFYINNFKFNLVYIWLIVYSFVLLLCWIVEIYIAIKTKSCEKIYIKLFQN